MVYIGIDPGKSGAIACLKDYESGMVDVELTPFDEAAYVSKLSFYAKSYAIRGCVVERVNAYPGQGVTSMFNFGTNYGFIQGVLRAVGMPFELVPPGTWKRAFGVTKDKNTSVAVAQRLFPDASLLRTEKCRKPDDGFAEALLMAEYARRKMGGAKSC